MDQAIKREGDNTVITVWVNSTWQIHVVVPTGDYLPGEGAPDAMQDAVRLLQDVVEAVNNGEPLDAADPRESEAALLEVRAKYLRKKIAEKPPVLTS